MAGYQETLVQTLFEELWASLMAPYFPKPTSRRWHRSAVLGYDFSV
jgi:hypothetical protein